MKRLLIFIVFALNFSCIFSQEIHYLQLNQSQTLIADAGDDVSIEIGESVQLGALQVVTGGYGDYIYLWEPNIYLNDNTLAHPMATPEVTTTYLLTVVCGFNLQTPEQGNNFVEASGVEIDELDFDMLIFPNPSSGIVNVKLTGYTGACLLQICNILGQEVYRKNLWMVHDHTEEVDLTLTKKGLFFVRCTGSRLMEVSTFILSR